MKTVEAARGRWPGICRHFGIEERFLRNKHGPCPMCGGKDRFRFDDRNGSGSYFCSGCGNGDGFKLIEHITGRDFASLAKEIDSIVGNLKQHEPSKKRNPAIRLKEVAGSRASMGNINPVRLYLQSRGLTPVEGIQYSLGVTHWEDNRLQTFPAMICLMQASDGTPLSFHITYLTPAGEKAPVKVVKKILTPMRTLGGSAIRLGSIHEHIGIAEGIETALAVSMQYSIPCWAAANAGLLEQFEPPDGVKAVTIFGDSDKSYTGQKSAFVLAHRLAKTHGVDVVIPDNLGQDFADLQEVTV